MEKSRENVKRTSKISAVVVDHTNKIFLSRLIFFSPQLSKFVFSVLCKKKKFQLVYEAALAFMADKSLNSLNI
jgi:hypothetical protein